MDKGKEKKPMTRGKPPTTESPSRGNQNQANTKEGEIKFESISLVHYVVNMATTPTIAPKLLSTIG
jgi:hypothetical protein